MYHLIQLQLQTINILGINIKDKRVWHQCKLNNKINKIRQVINMEVKYNWIQIKSINRLQLYSNVGMGLKI